MKLSIIIPVLNEEDYIVDTIETMRLRGNAAHECIVVDCDSSDATVARAEALGIRVLRGNGEIHSRARAMNLGAAAASGDVLFFLHADAEVPQDFDRMLLGALADENVFFGAFEFAFIGKDWRLRMVEFINRLRYRIRAIYYGDQGIFIKKESFDRMGGFPEVAFMEDSLFCKKALGFGGATLLKAKILVSPRRFYEGGFWRVLGLDIWYWFRNAVGLNNQKYAAAYQKNNKNRGN